MNDFWADNDGQRKVRDAVLIPHLYKQISMQGRFVCADKGRFAELLQRRSDVDTIVEREDGLVAVEEKIVRWKGRVYTAVTLETDSCTLPGLESPGWMHYCEADKLLWVMCQGDGTVIYHVFGLPELKAAFWGALEKYPDLFPVHIEPSRNRTRSRVVDIEWIRNAGVPYAMGRIDPGPEGREIVRLYNEN